MSDELEKRLESAHVRFAGESEDEAKNRRNEAIKEAAATLRRYRKALERIGAAKSAMDGGSIAECRRIARQALGATQ